MLAVVGDIVEDIVVWTSGPITLGTDNQSTIFRTRGGSAANVAGFAASTHPTRFIGCIGDDYVGQFLVDELTSAGVDVCVQRAGTTGTIAVLIGEDGERTMFPNRAASTMLESVDVSWLDGVRMLHIPAYSFDGEPIRSTTLELIAQATARNIDISLDASSTHIIAKHGVENFKELLAEIEPRFLIANFDEAQLLGFHQPDTAQALLSRMPTTVCVLKAGSEPTQVLRHRHDPLIVAVAPVSQIIDTTGAGDAFAAGFLTSFLSTADLVQACESGHSRARMVLQSPGASSGTAPAASG